MKRQFRRTPLSRGCRASAQAAMAAALLALAMAAGAQAPTPSPSPQPGQPAQRAVSLAGSMGDRALLVIDGGAPRAVAVGATHAGVTVVSVSGASAVVEIGGRRQTLVLGAAPVNLGVTGATADRIVLAAGPGGHFVTDGAINGRTVRFMVDTGASNVALGEAEAERLGLDLRGAPQGLARTANGTVPFRRVLLATVRVGTVELRNVEAVVLPTPMETVLLGNSFLERFRWSRDNSTMTLERRY